MLKRVLGLVSVLSFTAGAMALIGCPSAPATTPEPPPPTTPATAAPSPTPAAPSAGKPCKANSECGTGEMCDFAPGCDAPGTCVAQKPCTRDLVPYCGCDGQTFHSSGTCPERPYSKRGGCDNPAPPPGSKKACNSDADCANGEQCQGNEGCGAPWTCGPARRCTRDSVEWCACDGTTFRGSGTCPAKPVRHRGKC